MRRKRKSFSLLTDQAAIGVLLERLLIPVVLFLCLFLFGVLGFYLTGSMENNPEATLINCVYHTSVLLTTVGFTDVLHTNHTWSQTLVTLFMAFFGAATLVYIVSTITAFVVSGEMTEILEMKRMKKRIAELKDHYIVCGGGETGRHVVKELIETDQPHVILELDPMRVERLNALGDVCYRIGDASEDEALEAVGVRRARRLIATLPADKDNLLCVITARQINPSLRIISRCVEPGNEAKLRKAGADSVVTPTRIGGLRMASELIRPRAVSFLDTMLRSSSRIRFEDVQIPTGHSLAGKSIAEAKFPSIADLNIIATREPGAQEFHYNPHGDMMIRPGMDLVFICNPEEAKKLRAFMERG